MTEETIKTVERGLLTGMSFTLIKPVAGGRSTISGLQLRTLRLTRPDVNERLARAARNPITFRSMLRSGSVAQIKGLQLEPPGEFVPNSDILLYVPQEGDYEWFHSLTPRYLQRSAREEIVGYLYLELVERRVDRAGVPACARRIIAAYNKENPMKAYGDIRTPLPLDAPAHLDGTMSRAEIVSEGLWSWTQPPELLLACVMGPGWEEHVRSRHKGAGPPGHAGGPLLRLSGMMPTWARPTWGLAG